MPPTLLHVYFFLFGAIVGSFLNVVIVRLPKGESIIRPRSRCPVCQDSIPAWLNIPILSYFVLRGRCRSCRAPLSIRYPVVETLTAILFLAVGKKFGPSLAALTSLILVGALVAITFIDIDIWEIPDEISLPGIALGCLLRPLAFDTAWYDGLVGALVGGGLLWLVRWVFYLIRRMEGLGLGDVKLIAMIGAFLGPESLLPSILIASVSGAAIGLLLIALGRAAGGDETPQTEEGQESEEDPEQERDDEEESDEEEDWTPPKHAVPFGPFLSIGAMVQLLIGPLVPASLIRGLITALS